MRELRDGLSRHLAEVRSGRVVTVTDHGRPIARIVPVERPTRLGQLRAEGRVRPARRRKRRAPEPVACVGYGQRPGRRATPVIGYVATSAFVPLLVAEPTTGACQRLWDDADMVVTSRLLSVETAAALARRFALRGYDSVHCASAEQLDDEDVVAASGDRRLLAAWAEPGMAAYDPNATPEPDDVEAAPGDLVRSQARGAHETHDLM